MAVIPSIYTGTIAGIEAQRQMEEDEMRRAQQAMAAENLINEMAMQNQPVTPLPGLGGRGSLVPKGGEGPDAPQAGLEAPDAGNLVSGAMGRSGGGLPKAAEDEGFGALIRGVYAGMPLDKLAQDFSKVGQHQATRIEPDLENHRIKVYRPDGQVGVIGPEIIGKYVDIKSKKDWELAEKNRVALAEAARAEREGKAQSEAEEKGVARQDKLWKEYQDSLTQGTHYGKDDAPIRPREARLATITSFKRWMQSERNPDKILEAWKVAREQIGDESMDERHRLDAEIRAYTDTLAPKPDAKSEEKPKPNLVQPNIAWARGDGDMQISKPNLISPVTGEQIPRGGGMITSGGKTIRMAGLDDVTEEGLDSIVTGA